MNVTTHERPGVYSVYGASSLVRGSGGRKTVGLAAVNTKTEAGVIQTITSYEEAVSTFGSQADSQDMAELIRVILLNGAAAVAVVPVANAEGYEAAFAALSGMEDLSVVVCDSTDQEVQQKLRNSVTAASAARRERIAVVAGGAEESVTALTDRAKALNRLTHRLAGCEMNNCFNTRIFSKHGIKAGKIKTIEFFKNRTYTGYLFNIVNDIGARV